MKSKKQLMMMIAGASLLALSACGKGDFNGTYTGYATDSGGVTYGSGSAQTMTINMRQNDDTVSGDVSASMSQYGGQAVSMSGKFTASAQNSGSLENVQLFMTSSGTGTTSYMPNSMGYGTQIYSGSLTAGEDGATINGTLTSVSTGTTMGGTAQSASKILNLTRQGDN